MRSRRFAAGCVLYLALAATGTAGAAGILIGTGVKDGVDYQAGRALCRVIERNQPAVRCEPRPTAGSLFNLENVNNGALDLGIVRSDWHYHAVTRTGPFRFSDTRYDNLRALFSLYSEPFTLLVNPKARISTLGDLPGKRVNIGSPGSPQRASMETVMAAKGWNEDSFLLAEQLPVSQQSLAFCHGRLQAVFFTVPHPDLGVAKAAGLCNGVIVAVRDADIERLVADTPFYFPTEIPGGLYPNNPQPVPTFGAVATVVTSADAPDEDVYGLVKAVFDQLDRLRRIHPAFRTLEPERMVTVGLSADLHPGARRYYEEAGLLKSGP